MASDAVSHGIDRRQLRTLVRTGLRLDWRGGVNPFTGMSNRKPKFPGMLVIILFDMFFSLLFGALLVKMPGLFEGLVITAIGPFVLIALAVLVEFSQIIITPADYHVVAAHPVNSRTFFAAKLVHLLVYVTILSAACALFPAIVASFKFDSILAFPVVVLHYWLVSVFASVFIITVFVAILRGANRHRMEKFVGYAQIALLILFYTAMNIVPKQLQNIERLSRVDEIPWMALIPTYWFAAPVRLVTHGFDWQLFGAAVLGFALLAGLWRITMGYLSVSYARSLADSGVAAMKKRRQRFPLVVRRFWNRITYPEVRALALLAWAQFKNDLSFRMQVIWIVPVTLFLLLFSYFDSEIGLDDPFAPRSDKSAIGGTLYGMFMVWAPGMIHAAMMQSKAWKASWVFHATPIDRRRMVAASKWIGLGLMVFVAAPILFAVLAMVYGNSLHALMYVIYVIVLASLTLTVMVGFMPKLPFATESAHGQWSGTAFLMFTVTGVVLVIPVVVLVGFGFWGYLGWTIATAVTILLTFALTRWQNRRIDRKVRTWEMEG